MDQPSSGSSSPDLADTAPTSAAVMGNLSGSAGGAGNITLEETEDLQN